MAQNFIQCDREQLLLMSSSLREWLPENHLAWFVIDAVKDIDLSPFYARYRQDGWGRAAYDPAMMVAIVLYAYAKGQRSSRGIERACVEDAAYRVIAANLAPDHVTINRFRAEHSDALAGLFGSVLTLCARAGMVKVGTIAVDGTKVQRTRAASRTQTSIRSRGRSSKRPPKLTRPRTSSTARSAAMSYRSTYLPARVVVAGCARPNASSMRNAPKRPGRSRVLDRPA